MEILQTIGALWPLAATFGIFLLACIGLFFRVRAVEKDVEKLKIDFKSLEKQILDKLTQLGESVAFIEGRLGGGSKHDH